MPVLLSTGDLGNRIDILQGNGVTEDLTVDRSVVSEAIIDSEDSVVLQVSQCFLAKASISFSTCSSVGGASSAAVLKGIPMLQSMLPRKERGSNRCCAVKAVVRVDA